MGLAFARERSTRCAATAKAGRWVGEAGSLGGLGKDDIDVPRKGQELRRTVLGGKSTQFGERGRGGEGRGGSPKDAAGFEPARRKSPIA